MKRSFTILPAVLLLFAASAGASTFLAVDQEGLILRSDAVVEGRVIQVDSFWEETGTIIVTEATVQVSDALLGKTPSLVVVRTFGGEVDGFRVDAHGFPTFAENDHVLLFLARENDDYSRVAGYQQGHYRIQHSSEGQAIAVPTLDEEARLLTAEGELADAPQTRSLDELKQSIRADAQRLGRVSH